METFRGLVINGPAAGKTIENPHPKMRFYARHTNTSYSSYHSNDTRATMDHIEITDYDYVRYIVCGQEYGFWTESDEAYPSFHDIMWILMRGYQMHSAK